MTSNRRRLALGASSLGLFFLGCMSDHNSGCDAKSTGIIDTGCPSGALGPPHGLRADSRVDVSGADAWPDRASQSKATPADLAGACAAYAACVPSLPQTSDWSTWSACIGGSLRFPSVAFGISTAERAVLFDGANETLDFFVNAVLGAQGDCTVIRSVLTKRTAPIECQEDGCYQTDGATTPVTCQGDVATFGAGSSAVTRDCSRALTHCSAASQTGCTDRPLVQCTAPAKDRCDGDVKLGCDHCGVVSFHDCAWNGGHCEGTPDGAHCVDAGDGKTCFGVTSNCNGTKLSVCVSGIPIEIDCAAFGMGCQKVSTGASRIPDAGGQCFLAPCSAPMCVIGAPAVSDAGGGDGG